jgi:hypothetical protein
MDIAVSAVKTFYFLMISKWKLTETKEAKVRAHLSQKLVSTCQTLKALHESVCRIQLTNAWYSPIHTQEVKQKGQRIISNRFIWNHIPDLPLSSQSPQKDAKESWWANSPAGFNNITIDGKVAEQCVWSHIKRSMGMNKSRRFSDYRLQK